ERAWAPRWRRLPIPGPGRPGDNGARARPQADDVAPGNSGMLCAELLAEGVRSLPDDLQQALYCELPDPVLVPGVPAKLDDRADFAGGVQDVGGALVVPAAHRSTDSARMARS